MLGPFWEGRRPLALSQQTFVDADYAMYAGGLLATLYPELAIKLVASSLRPVEIPYQLLINMRL